MRELSLGAGMILGAVFLAAGVAKLRLGGLVRDLDAYDLIPPRLVSPVARGLPWLELATGTALLLGLMTRAALLCAAGLLLVFSSGMIVNLARGRRIGCGCGSPTRQISWWLVARNVTLAIVAVRLAWHEPPAGLRWLLQPPPNFSSSNAFATLVSLALLASAVRVLTVGARLVRLDLALRPLRDGAFR